MTTTIHVLACMLVLGAAPGARAQTQQEEPDFPTEPEGPAPANPDVPPTPPWKTRFGVLLDAGAPEGVGVSALMQLRRWARVYGGPSRNTLGFGVRAGATLTPFQLLVSPTLDLNVGHYFNADYEKLLPQLRGQPTTPATGIREVSYNQVTGRLGLEFSPSRHVTLFGGVGVSYWYFQVDDPASFIQEAEGSPDITAKPLAIHLTSPAVKLGLIIYFN